MCFNVPLHNSAGYTCNIGKRGPNSSLLQSFLQKITNAVKTYLKRHKIVTSLSICYLKGRLRNACCTKILVIVR